MTLRQDIDLLANNSVSYYVEDGEIKCDRLKDVITWCITGFKEKEVISDSFVRLEVKGLAFYGTPIAWHKNYYLDDPQEAFSIIRAIQKLSSITGDNRWASILDGIPK